MMALMEGLAALEVGRGPGGGGSRPLALPKKGGCVIRLGEDDCTFPDIKTMCRRFVMEEATKFGGGGRRVKGGAPNNGMSCQSVRWAWSSSIVHIGEGALTVETSCWPKKRWATRCHQHLSRRRHDYRRAAWEPRGTSS
jgi:hypothetical protein